MNLDYQLIFGFDKLMHFLGYGAVAILLGLIILLSDQQYVKQKMSYICE